MTVAVRVSAGVKVRAYPDADEVEVDDGCLLVTRSIGRRVEVLAVYAPGAWYSAEVRDGEVPDGGEP